MKKLYVIAFILFSTHCSVCAQTISNTFPDSGKVGIGTTNPNAWLHIETGNNADHTGIVVRGKQPDLILDQTFNSLSTTVSFQRQGSDRVLIGMNKNDDLYFSRFVNGNPNDSAMVMERLTGNIGIGTSNPTQKLHVVGNTLTTGNLYIGSIDTTKCTGYSLAVNGSALFTKAVVKPYLNWPDYVFKSDYKLPSIDSLELFLKENKHLPEMPVAAEVKKDGINLADSQVLLLKKIEELTLYVIQLQKDIDRLKSERKQ